MKNKTVAVYEDTVVKTDSPDRLRVEAEKTARAYEIGRESGLFRSPRVIDFNPSKGELVLERLHDIQQLGLIFNNEYRDDRLIEIIAASMAAIHTSLSLPEDMCVPLPPELEFAGDSVFLHGDFSMKNVLVTSDRSDVVILDWQMTGKHGGRASIGTRYFDVLWFVSNILGAMCRLSAIYPHAKHAIPTAARFLKSYVRSAGITDDVELIISYIRKFFEMKLKQRKRDDNWRHKSLNWAGNKKIHELTQNPELLLEYM